MISLMRVASTPWRTNVARAASISFARVSARRLARRSTSGLPADVLTRRS
jgi:hypothetical protein